MQKIVYINNDHSEHNVSLQLFLDEFSKEPMNNVKRSSMFL